METELSGVIVPLATPFDTAGEIDESAYRQQIRFMLKKNVHGLCVGGSTGEGYALGIDELRRLTAWAVDEANGRVPVVAGVIATSTRDAILRARAVADLGVTALQITPTFYVFKASDEDSFRHFKAISEAVSLPIIIYNVIRTNELGAELLVRIMSEIPAVVGVKQSQGDIKLAADLLIMAPKGKRVYAALFRLRSRGARHDLGRGHRRSRSLRNSVECSASRRPQESSIDSQKVACFLQQHASYQPACVR